MGIESSKHIFQLSHSLQVLHETHTDDTHTRTDSTENYMLLRRDARRKKASELKQHRQ